MRSLRFHLLVQVVWGSDVYRMVWVDVSALWQGSSDILQSQQDTLCV